MGHFLVEGTWVLVSPLPLNKLCALDKLLTSLSHSSHILYKKAYYANRLKGRTTGWQGAGLMSRWAEGEDGDGVGATSSWAMEAGHHLLIVCLVTSCRGRPQAASVVGVIWGRAGHLLSPDLPARVASQWWHNEG